MGFRDRFYTGKDVNVSGRDVTSELMEQQHLDVDYQKNLWDEKHFQSPSNDMETSYLESRKAAHEESFIAQYGYSRRPKRWEEECQYTKKREDICGGL